MFLKVAVYMLSGKGRMRVRNGATARARKTSTAAERPALCAGCLFFFIAIQARAYPVYIFQDIGALYEYVQNAQEV